MKSKIEKLKRKICGIRGHKYRKTLYEGARASAYICLDCGKIIRIAKGENK